MQRGGHCRVVTVSRSLTACDLITQVLFNAYCLQGVVPEPLLKERLDVETLDTLGIVPSTKAFNQKYVRTKTKLLYVYTINKG